MIDGRCDDVLGTTEIALKAEIVLEFAFILETELE